MIDIEIVIFVIVIVVIVIFVDAVCYYALLKSFVFRSVRQVNVPSS